MGAGSNVWLAPIAVALITALGTYVGIARRTSGRIATTEANKLWDEAKDLREVYQHEISRLRVEIDSLEAESAKREGENTSLRRELREVNARYDECQRRTTALQIRVEELEDRSFEEV